MPVHLQRAIHDIKQRLLAFAGVVEESVYLAVKAVETRDPSLANNVIIGDGKIDRTEVDIEEECLKILALYQPVAIDLRSIVAVLKINNDLERIGDCAVNIAERVSYFAVHSLPDVVFDFPGMASKAQAMLQNGLDALVRMDTGLARYVCEKDDEVDEMNRNIYQEVKDAMRENPEGVDALLHLLGVSRHLERIADLATNIAEDVIYLVEGEIVRHRAEDYT